MSSLWLDDSESESYPHWPWFAVTSGPISVHSHYLSLLKHFGKGPGEVVGPEDWYLSRADIYKCKTGLRHESFVATFMWTPRHQVPGCSTLPHNTGPISYTLERSRNKGLVGVSKSGPGTPAGQALGGDQTLSISGSAGRSELIIKFGHGGHTAFDKVSFCSTGVSDQLVKDFDQIGSLCFSLPSFTLPHEEDWKTVWNLLVESRDDTVLPPVPGSTHPTMPTFISLPMLISLACTIGNTQPFYTLTKHNCYWFSLMLFFALRCHSNSDILVPISGTSDHMALTQNADADFIKRTFSDAIQHAGHHGTFKIIETLGEDEIGKILDQWKCDLRDMNREYCTRRISALRRRWNLENDGSRKHEEELRKKWRLKGVPEEEIARALEDQIEE